MRKVTDLFKEKLSPLTIAVILTVAYVLMQDVFSTLPYLNVLTKELVVKLAILWILLILLIRPSANTLLKMLIILLFVDSMWKILRLGIDDQGLGLVMYVTLLYLLYKLLKSGIDYD